MHVVSTHNVKALVGQVSLSYSPSHRSSTPTRILYKVLHVDLIYVIVGHRLSYVKLGHFGCLSSARRPPLKRSRQWSDRWVGLLRGGLTKSPFIFTRILVFLSWTVRIVQVLCRIKVSRLIKRRQTTRLLNRLHRSIGLQTFWFFLDVWSRCCITLHLTIVRFTENVILSAGW